MPISEMQGLDLWRRATVVGLHKDRADLSVRQMAVLLTVYLTPPPHTVRGLAAELGVSKPAVTRALDRLSELGLARRRVDVADRRSVIVQRTVAGSVFLREWGETVAEAAVALDSYRGAA